MTKSSCAGFLVIILIASAAQAQSAPYVNEPTQGGYMDTQTKLVWVDYSLVSGSLCTWTYARDRAANYVDTTSGKSDWRLPTVQELQDASGKEIYKYVPTIEIWAEGDVLYPDSGYFFWSSESTKKKGGQAWAVRLKSPVHQTGLWPQDTATTVMFVRQATP